ncbi:hypothetical protein Poli38472_006156 [Pythium oligandrum]|uniref:CSC1/OSCA1-like cytosolic domain-containing protein n=1 Tax=Pythium oligandrum TaxID=41045 RepID=A0A8K1CTK3_PYTOL|nr:hypothetical protein Poli38472_006156 [Pythium oligandrum]|eukprot:TMW68688.1 hypothetical protein Poli38472_006156 [Pythium oligandrum]
MAKSKPRKGNTSSGSSRESNARTATDENLSIQIPASYTDDENEYRATEPTSPSKDAGGGGLLAIDIKKLHVVTSPRSGAQLGGYPPDCGTKEHKYLSYAKVLHERGQTHPMSFSTTDVDAVGNPVPEAYPLSTDFGAHSFHRLPTDSFVLSQYGVGMTLYFKYLKVMSWLFLILVILSGPSLLIYTVSGTGSLDEFKMLAKQSFPQILGMTTIGHLKESSSTCDQVVEGSVLSLSCPAGEIGFIKAVYSTYDDQGSCACPEINKVAEGNGLCRGKPNVTCSGGECTSVCPSDGYGCFVGTHPVSKLSCCAKTLDSTTQKPNFDDMRIHSTRGCSSKSIQMIVDGLCLNRKSCSFNVSEALTYKWKVDESLETYCDPPVATGETCEARITDDSDFSACDDSMRGLIVYARCFTTRIDLSNEWSLKIIGWDSISRRDFLGLAVGSDIACSICFFCIVLWMKRKETENVARINKDQIKAMDYTVQLMHLPKHSDLHVLKRDIRSHLEYLLSKAPEFAQSVDRIHIADIQFGKSSSSHLELLRKRGKLVRKLEVAMQRLEKVKLLNGRVSERAFIRKLKKHFKETQKLEMRLRSQNARIERWHHRNQENGVQAVTAFITFEEEEGYHRCLTEYPDLGLLYRLFQPKFKRLHGKRLRFRPAPDPTDIVWENLHHPYWERLLRQAAVAFITLAVLCLSFILILLAKLQNTRLERQFGRPSSCPASVTKDDVIEDETQKLIGLVPYKVLVECYCKNVLTSHSFAEMTHEVFYNPTTKTSELYCKSWATSYVTTQALSGLSVFMVVCINILLARILNVLVTMEKHHTHSGQVVSHVVKVFLAQFCNTAILVVIINANLNYFFENKTIGFESFPILNGKYADLSPGWYNDVGVSIILTMIVNTYSPHIYVIFDYVRLEAKRLMDRGFSFNYSLTKQDTQHDLEALYRGPKFDLASRYAQSLTSVFITYLFSAGMPILHLVGFMEMMMTYWADKFTFLRIARSPPLYDAKVATAAGSLLPYAVILHSLMAMWMFSNALIFQSSSDIVKQLTAENVLMIGEDIPSFDVERGDIFGRISRPQVVVLFGFFVAFGFVVVVHILLFEYFPSVLQTFCPILARFSQKSNVSKGIPNYFDAIPTNILRDKLQAPHLNDALRAKYLDALEKRGVSSYGKADSPTRSPRRRNKRRISAAEHYNDEKWIVGCPSYAIRDNKEYVDELAIDSHLTADINLDEFF